MTFPQGRTVFSRNKLEYLGLWFIREGIKPLKEKILDIFNMKSPTPTKQDWQELGFIDFNWIYIPNSLTLSNYRYVHDQKGTFIQDHE